MFDIWLFTAIARADELSGKDLEGLRTSLSVSKGQKIDQNNSRSGTGERKRSYYFRACFLPKLFWYSSNNDPLLR